MTSGLVTGGRSQGCLPTCHLERDPEPDQDEPTNKATSHGHHWCTTALTRTTVWALLR